MRTKIFHIALIFCFFASLSLSGQIKQANNYFEQFKYSKAIPFFKKATSDKDLKVRKEASARLADCYRLVNNASEAAVWYAKIVEFGDASPETYYYLGTTLRSLAHYDEAEKAFDSYVRKNPSDFRGKIYGQYCRDIKEWNGLPPCAEIKNASEINSPYSDFGPMFYKDEVIFTSDRDIDMMADKNYLWTSFGYLDLYSSQPLADHDFWGALTNPLKMGKSFNQAYHDGPASFTSDSKEIFTTRTLKTNAKRDSAQIKTDCLKIFYANLSDDRKVEYKPFPFNSDNYSVGHPAISPDGKKLIFSSDKPEGFGGSDLYVSEWIDGKWSTPVGLGPEVNTFGNEVFPFLANDSTLFFSSDGHPGYGGLDVYETKLVHGKWSTPWNLKLPINSPYDDFSIVFSKNLTDGFFSSNRPGGKGSDDIYAFRNYKRTPMVEVKPAAPEKLRASVKGYVKDKKTLLPLDSATVFFLDSKTDEVHVVKTDSKGYFEASANFGVKYIVKGMKQKFFDDCLSVFVPAGGSATSNTVSLDLLLDRYAVNQVFKIENIYYDLNKWLIRDDAKPSLDKLVGILKQYPISVELGSHTDCRASSAYNNSLSQKRAESVVKYLIENGIDPKRLTSKGYGETQLINKCADGVPCSEAEHQANRRTEFKITSINAPGAPNPVDLKLFKAGDKIPLEKLGADFFKDCREVPVAFSYNSSAPGARFIVPGSSKPAVFDNKITFAVQVAAATSSIKIIPKDFRNKQIIHEKKMGQVFRYFSGRFDNLNQASKEKKRLQAKFPGAFIVEFKGDNLIPVDQAMTN